MNTNLILLIYPGIISNNPERRRTRGIVSVVLCYELWIKYFLSITWPSFFFHCERPGFQLQECMMDDIFYTLNDPKLRAKVLFLNLRTNQETCTPLCTFNLGCKLKCLEYMRTDFPLGPSATFFLRMHLLHFCWKNFSEEFNSVWGIFLWFLKLILKTLATFALFNLNVGSDPWNFSYICPFQFERRLLFSGKYCSWPNRIIEGN